MTERRKPLKRSTKPIKRSWIKRKPNKNAIPQESKDAVNKRSDGRCEFRHEPHAGCETNLFICRTPADSRGPHHIERRRGRNHEPDNLLNLCVTCHQFVHANPAWSYEHGYMKRMSK